jgi:hypothetical protein
MQLAALAAVISYFWRDVSDLLGSLSAIGRRLLEGNRPKRPIRNDFMARPSRQNPLAIQRDYRNETDNDNQRADRRQKQPAQKPYHSIR